MPGPVSGPSGPYLFKRVMILGTNAQRHQICYDKGNCCGPGCAFVSGKTELKRRRT